MRLSPPGAGPPGAEKSANSSRQSLAAAAVFGAGIRSAPASRGSFSERAGGLPQLPSGHRGRGKGVAGGQGGSGGLVFFGDGLVPFKKAPQARGRGPAGLLGGVALAEIE